MQYVRHDDDNNIMDHRLFSVSPLAGSNSHAGGKIPRRERIEHSDCGRVDDRANDGRMLLCRCRMRLFGDIRITNSAVYLARTR